MKSIHPLAAALVAAAIAANGAIALADSMSDSGKDYMAMGAMHGRFGGPVYSGPPALDVTAALVAAGGGASNYSTATALTNMVGKDLVGQEVAKLSKQYGQAKVTQWLKTFDFAVTDALKIATAAGVKLPAPAPLKGKDLAVALVKAGLDKGGAFQIEYLLDKAVSHKIHVAVMNDIDKNPAFGKSADLWYHLISNQAFYDLAQALGATSVKLAPLH
ncbi:MAG TPA: hypothetical protein VN934_04530 [Candidatus Tumulicola sp.]|nr:hypothetical protein [Candidatus Tumulicola sp.]